MLKRSRHSQAPPAGGRGSTPGKHRGLLVLALFSNLAGLHQPAQAAPARDVIWILPELEVAPGTITLCPHQSTEIYVTYRADQYRASNPGAAMQGQPVSGVTISGTVANSNVGHLVRSSTTTQPWGAGTSAIFSLVAGSSVGQTVIRFEAEEVLAPLVGPNGEDIVSTPPPPITVNLAVHCEYLVMASSFWVLPGERQLFTMGTLTSVVAPDSNGSFNSVPAAMTSSAFWVGPCPGTSTIEPSIAELTGYVDQDKFAAAIDFQPVQAFTGEGCKGKSSSDSGQPWPLSFDVPASGGTVIQNNHVLSAYVDVPGTTEIIVLRLAP